MEEWTPEEMWVELRFSKVAYEDRRTAICTMHTVQ